MSIQDELKIWGASGAHGVTLEKGVWADATRNRTVPWKLYKPDNTISLTGATAPAGNSLPESPAAFERKPLIIWSHGLGGTRDGAGFLGRHMASHGFWHLHIQHDGTDDALWRNQPDVHPWDAIRAAMPLSWGVVRERYLDMPFVLDMLPKQDWAIDTHKVGICGHSFGALSTQVVAGTIVGRKDHPEMFQDDRFITGILYSPVPGEHAPVAIEKLYAHVNKPLLHITGTNDTSPLSGNSYKDRLEAYHYASLAGKAPQHLAILNEADHMVFNGSRGQLPPYPDMALHQDVLKTLSLIWWRAYLLNDPAAQAFLNGAAVKDWFAAFGTYQ